MSRLWYSHKARVFDGRTLRDLLLNEYQNFIALSRYARWRDEDNRRETWEESVNRYVRFMSATTDAIAPWDSEIDYDAEDDYWISLFDE